ncbi:N-acetyltransferase [Deinococcus irradiatisoli]|uniref:N-acetyltransferase n=1 Tax=Deinococcus irradiatisoli TaxID=2202254 RepID=A0A2Z3JK72_9DEIO|nr:GNAT family N-acetyltransferase [Deinococcus irradiatisoli]AWN22318.1 N-acetyltransferase [Deinococcus irradiatisoli]
MSTLPAALPMLKTPRLTLLPLTHEMVVRQLAGAPFAFEVPEVGLVAFGRDWPGARGGFFPGWAEQPGQVSDWVIVSAGQALGMIGPKGPLSGAVDIGYGLRPSSWNQGFASEAAQAVSDWLLSLPHVECVTADTAVGNAASARVLEKSGFVETGRAFSEDDGELRLWEKRRKR